MVQWTDEQLAAIESRHENLLLSAAAGSGKTAVLVERIIQLVCEDRIPIDEMLVITFTKAAAAEMKERILKGLRQKISESQVKDPFIRRQMTMINQGNISTIHSFCMEVIRRNFHDLDIDPGFRILDSSEKDILFRKVVETLLVEEYAQKNEAYIDLVESYTSNRSDETLTDMLTYLYGFIRSKEDPFTWLEKKVLFYDIDPSNFMAHPWFKKLSQFLVEDLEISKKYLWLASELCLESTGPKEYLEAIQSDLNQVEDLIKKSKDNLFDFFDELATITYMRLGRISKKRKDSIDQHKQNQAKKLRDQSKKRINKIADTLGYKPLDLQMADLKKMRPLMAYLEQMVLKIHTAYMGVKIEKNALDFNDLEQLTLELLKNERIKNQYKNKFQQIFVDEYQDTNSIQEAIVQSIRRDDNLFFVGDVKQSIYKFRLAEPELFLSKYENFGNHKKDADRLINLTKNFRTRGRLLKGINYIFSQLMSKSYGEIDYDEKAYLYQGLDFKPVKGVDHPMEINILNADKKLNALEDSEALLELKTSELEAISIVNRIKNLIGQDTYDPKMQSFRPIEYRDIVILMRATSGWGSVFEEVFAKEGLPFYYEGGGGYLQSLEIEMFLNVLKVIDNKKSDVPLLSAMRSPFGGFSINELIKIRLAKKEGSFYEALEFVAKEDLILSEKSKAFIERINYWYEVSRQHEMDVFIEKLLDQSGFLDFMQGLPGGNLRRGNLKLLIEKAKMFSDSSMSGLFNFIKVIEKIGQVNGDFDTANVISETENVVRLMSIHKSKGLEFPVVILARGNRQMKSMHHKNPLVCHKDLGIGADYIDYINRMKSPTIPKYVIKKAIDLENIAEEMRILYVALTRSVDQLIIFGTYSRGLEKKLNTWTMDDSKMLLKSSKSYTDWIMNLISTTKGASVIYELVDKPFKNNGVDLFNIYISDLEDLKDENDSVAAKSLNVKEKLINPSFDGTWVDDLMIPPAEKNENIQGLLKVSVTDLKTANKNDADFRLFDMIPKMQKTPNFIKESDGLSPFDIGNAYHFVMEKININTLKNQDIKSQIKQMFMKGEISEQEYKILDIESIENFFKSSLGNRLKNSQEIKREQPFTYRFDAHYLVQGIIDLYFKEGDQWVIVDYKTDRINKSNEALLISEHKEQLNLYQEALEGLTGIKVKERILYFFRNNKFYSV